MINSIELRGFKSHENSSLRFGPGTNVIVGVMGSGKSSVMDALCYCLFGTFPALKSRRIQLSNVIRGFGAGKADAATMTLKLSRGRTEYAVTRKISPDGSEAFLRKDGMLVDGPQPQRVNEAVQKIIGMDYDLFVRTAYCEQNRIDYFLELGKGERKRQLDELLGIDRLERGRQTLSTIQNRLTAEANALRSEAAKARPLEEIGKTVDGLGLQLRENGNDAARLSEEAARAQEMLAASEAALAAARAEEEAIRQAATQIERAEATLRALATERQTRADRTEQLKAACGNADQKKTAELLCDSNLLVQGLERALIRAATEHNAAHAAASKAARLREAERQARERVRAELAAAGFESAEAAKESLAELSAKREDAARNAGQAAGLLEQAKKAVAALGGSHADCPVCKRPLAEGMHRRLEEERKGEVRRYEAEAAKAASLFSSLEAEAAKTTRAAGECSKFGLAAERLAEEAAAEEAASKDLPQKAAMFQGANAELAAARQENAALAKTAAAAESLDAERRALTLIEEKIAAQSAALGLAREKFGETAAKERKQDAYALEAAAKRAREDAYAAKLGLERVLIKTEALRGQVASAQQEFATATRSKQRLAEAERKAEKAKMLQGALVEVQEELRNRLLGAVNEALAAAWQVAYPYGDYSGIRLAPADDDYELELKTAAGEWVGVENASGGEKSVASLSLRVALARVLAPSLDILVLDEPTHNLDERGTAALAQALGNGALGAASFSQVFVITHDDGLREAAQGTLHVLERAKGGEHDASVVTDLTEKE